MFYLTRMPRQKRLNCPGALFHVVSRGIERRKIFLTDKDRSDFLKRLETGLKTTGYQCFAWALMDNHFHLLLRSGSRPLSDLMRSLMSGYAGGFNRRHKRRGVLFQNRYKSILCQEDSYLLELVRYIHLNPLRARVVPNLEELMKYPWTGHSTLIGRYKREFQEVDEVLAHFGTQRKNTCQAYLEFVADGVSMGRREDLTGGGLKRSAGGWEGVRKLKQEKEYWLGDDRILGDGQFVADILRESEEELSQRERLLREGWNLERLASKVCEILEVDPSKLKEKGRANDLARAKGAIAHMGSRKLGLSGKAIAYYLGVSRPAVSYLIKSGEVVVKDYKLEKLF